MRKHLAIALLSALSACGAPSPQADINDKEGREETQSIRNTESIGYSGNAIADKLDGALDAHDQRQQQLDDAERNQSE